MLHYNLWRKNEVFKLKFCMSKQTKLDYVYSKCDSTVAETYKARIDELSVNPSQAQIDICVNDMLTELKR